MTHHPCDTDLCHDCRTTTTAHAPTPAEAEVISLLGLNPAGRRLVRLDQAMWGHVHDIAAALAAARNGEKETA